MQRQDPYGLVGQVLDGQVRVDTPIGEGGCSVVYRGHHIGLDVPVAIKCLKLQQQLGTAFVQAFEQRFRDESKIQYRLAQGSLHIVRTLAAGTTIAPATSSLVPYMVLEWLDGFTLAEQLRARRERGERGRPLAEVVRMLDPVAEAMAFAHSLGVVHRDLNPSNLFVVVGPDGQQRLKVVDFGVAKLVGDGTKLIAQRAMTIGPVRLFTPAYGAPEQFSDTFGEVGPPTDVYAFALLLIELLLDRPPVEGDSLADYMERAVDTSVRPTPWTLGCTTIGESVEALLARALSVEPARRPEDLGAFWGALKHAMQHDEELTRRRSSQPPERLRPLGPTTKKGTLILRPESSFADSPSTSSIFAEAASVSRPTSSTVPLPIHQEPRPITIRPPGSAADPLGPTHGGDPRPGASPLSFTMQPGQHPISPLAQASLDRAMGSSPPPYESSPTTPHFVPPSVGPPTDPNSATLRSVSQRPPVRAPELATTPSSVPRWLLVVTVLTLVSVLAGGSWLLSRVLLR